MNKGILLIAVSLVTCTNISAATETKPETVTKPKTVTKPENNKFGLTAKLGTLGAGLDLTYKIKPKLNARLNLNKASADYEEEEDGVNYKGDLNLFTVGALVDFHPYQNGFRLSGGLFKNNNKISATATNPDDAEVGSTTYNISDGSLNSTVSFNSIAPYIGLGWGNAVKGPRKWHFSFDAGVLFQGQPKSTLTAAGIATAVDDPTTQINLATNEIFQSELAIEEDNLNSELEDFTAYPVISMGVSYKF